MLIKSDGNGPRKKQFEVLRCGTTCEWCSNAACEMTSRRERSIREVGGSRGTNRETAASRSRESRRCAVHCRNCGSDRDFCRIHSHTFGAQQGNEDRTGWERTLEEIAPSCFVVVSSPCRQHGAVSMMWPQWSGHNEVAVAGGDGGRKRSRHSERKESVRTRKASPLGKQSLSSVNSVAAARSSRSTRASSTSPRPPLLLTCCQRFSSTKTRA